VRDASDEECPFRQAPLERTSSLIAEQTGASAIPTEDFDEGEDEEGRQTAESNRDVNPLSVQQCVQQRVQLVDAASASQRTQSKRGADLPSRYRDGGDTTKRRKIAALSTISLSTASMLVDDQDLMREQEESHDKIQKEKRDEFKKILAKDKKADKQQRNKKYVISPQEIQEAYETDLEKYRQGLEVNPEFDELYENPQVERANRLEMYRLLIRPEELKKAEEKAEHEAAQRFKRQLDRAQKK
jgi:hypothetical protein